MRLILLLAVALAHEPRPCPSYPVLASRLGAEGLPEPYRGCVADKGLASPGDRALRWLGWRDRRAREGLTEEARAELDTLLAATTEPARALEAAEALEARDPAAARRALDAARRADLPSELAVRWIQLDARLAGSPERAARGLAALGVTGPPLQEARESCRAAGGKDCDAPGEWPLPAAEPPPAEAVGQCLDLGRMWEKAVLGGAYQTDRDCLARLLPAVDGDAASIAGHLALSVALGYRDRAGAVPVAHRVARALPGDASVARQVAGLHEELGDAEGAAWWRTRAEALDSSGSGRR